MGWPISVRDYVAATETCAYCPDWDPGIMDRHEAERLGAAHARQHDEAWRRYSEAADAQERPLPKPWPVAP